MRSLIAFLFLIVASELPAKVVSRINQLEEDPAVREVDREEDELREVVDDLDEPRRKPKEKSPNEVQMEQEEARSPQKKPSR